jgi:lipid II:glycine glycyltransferase (peptidoglycan interpeptide bridge formation enzyme)
MKPKGRYNIKLAEKKGVEIKIVEKTDKNIQYFYELMNETTSRD